MKIKRGMLLGILGILTLLGYGHAQDTIRDIRNLKQDHAFYLSGQSAEQPLVDHEVQQTLNEEYTRRYFSVWHQDRPRYALEDVRWDFNKYGENPGYGENRRKYDRSWVETLKLNAALDQYPNRGVRGIAVANTDLRALPTSSPYFNGLDNESGDPFDRLQISAVTANTPVYVSHISRDGGWVHVETSYYFGWVPAQDIAFVDETFARSWQSGRYAVLIRDRVPISDGEGRLFFKAPLGAQFPLLREERDFFDVWVGVAAENRQAVLKVARIGREQAVERPLRMSRLNLVRVANELINQPYGWGGFRQNRDCSSLMMDFFAPFGIWLPRNSRQQAQEAGRFVDLERLSPKEKEATILSYGVPYATLIWRKGHIMLYIGSYEGKALIFHDMWGVTTRDSRGQKGRKVVGRSVITTLRPGIEFCSGQAPGCDPLQSVLGMTLLLPNAPLPPAPLSAEPVLPVPVSPSSSLNPQNP